MATTKTNIHELEKQDFGDKPWDNPLNDSLDIIDKALVPKGGNADDILVKKTGADNDAEFRHLSTLGHALPVPPGAQLSGGIIGLEYEWKSTTELKIEAGSCFDSTNKIPLVYSGGDVSFSSLVASKVYNIFICEMKGTGAIEIKLDTYVNGDELLASGGVEFLRWFGLFKTTASGSIPVLSMQGNVLQYSSRTDAIAEANIPNTYKPIVLWHFMPEERVSAVMFAMGSPDHDDDALDIFDKGGANCVATLAMKKANNSNGLSAWYHGANGEQLFINTYLIGSAKTQYGSSNLLGRKFKLRR